MSVKSELANKSLRTGHRLSRRHIVQGALSMSVLAQSDCGLAAAQTEAEDSGQLRVFPGPGSFTASHGSQISFRGRVPEPIDTIYATGPDSGEHTGTAVVHSDGNGFSWFPDFEFQPGEEITVHTSFDIADVQDGDFSFTCAVPRGGRARGERTEEIEEANVRRFRSRPDLVPPRLVAESQAGELAPGYLFLSVIRGQGQNGALIIDNQGEPVWFRPADVPTHELFDLKVVDYKDERMLMWWEGIRVLGQGSGHWVICNTAYEQVATIRIGNGFAGGDMHDALITTQNTAIVGAYNPVTWDLTEVGGQDDGTAIDCVLQEIDIATGCVMFEWHSLDHVGLDESMMEIDPEEPDEAHDYFHYNSVAIDGDGNLLVCARNTWATYNVNRQTGEVIWRLGGKQSDFELTDGAEVAWQHDVRPLQDGRISIFDNSVRSGDQPESRGVVVALDTESMSASLISEYRHPDHIYAGSQGSMQILPNDNVLIGWGSEPFVTEYAADSTLLLEVQFPEEKQSYRARRFEWIGSPSEVPDLVAESDSGGGVVLSVSWNGATDVARWRVLTGTKQESLSSSLKLIPRDGFETEIPLVTEDRYFAVEALDADDNSLGFSRTVERHVGD